MNDRQLLEAAVNGIENPTKPQDDRSFWMRLLSSLRISVKAGKDSKKPIEEVKITGGVDF